MKKFFLGLFVALLSACLSPSVLATSTTTAQSISQDTTWHIKNTLKHIGLTSSVHTITHSQIDGLLEVSLDSGESFLITPDAHYIINGTPEINPSFIQPISPKPTKRQPNGTPIDSDHQKALHANLHAFKSINPDTVFFHTSIEGLLWAVADNGTPFLISDDGRYVIGADIGVIEHGKLIGLDNEFETHKNRHTLSMLDEATLTIYPAKKQRAVLYVATDIHCPYCRILHQKIPELNAKGITIKTIGYPVYDESFVPMSQIWCQQDNAKRATLLTLAMKGLNATQSCQDKDSLISKNIALARPLTIMATPAIYNERGEVFTANINVEALMNFLNLR